MNNAEKWISGLAVVVIVVLLIVVGGKGDSSQGDKPIVTIGVTAPLTGDLSVLGVGMRNAIELALGELEDTKYEYQIVYEDDQRDNTKTASAANKLLNVDNVNAIMSITSASGNVVSPIAQGKGVVHMSIGASDTGVAEGEYNFVHWTPPSEEGKSLVEELEERGLNNVAIIQSNDPGTKSITDAFVNAVEGSDIAVLTREVIGVGQTDYRSSINKIIQTNPQAIVVIVFSPDLEIVVQQINNMGVNVPLTSIEMFEASNNISLFNGHWYVTASEGTNEFRDKYEDRYNEEPPLASAHSYDGLHMIIQAYETVGDGISIPTSGDIAEALHAMTFEGAVGQVTVDEEGIVLSTPAVKEVQDGKPVLLQ